MPDQMTTEQIEAATEEAADVISRMPRDADGLDDLHVLLAAARQMLELIEKLYSDVFAEKVAHDCHDPDHDPRYCQTCSSRWDGIDAYRSELLKAAAEKENKTCPPK